MYVTTTNVCPIMYELICGADDILCIMQVLIHNLLVGHCISDHFIPIFFLSSNAATGPCSVSNDQWGLYEMFLSDVVWM